MALDLSEMVSDWLIKLILTFFTYLSFLGASMRISPVALYCLNKSDEFLIDLVTKTSEITHCNHLGINGAILQAFAILQNLKLKSVDDLKVDEYISELSSKMDKIDPDRWVHLSLAKPLN
jgi:ADP-ribosylglycohydrolase